MPGAVALYSHYIYRSAQSLASVCRNAQHRTLIVRGISKRFFREIMHTHPMTRSRPAMVITDEKQPPPLLYASVSSRGVLPSFNFHRKVPKLDSLPPNILLQIVTALFRARTVDATVHRKTLYWLAMHLRLVSRGMYLGTSSNLEKFSGMLISL